MRKDYGRRGGMTTQSRREESGLDIRESYGPGKRQKSWKKSSKRPRLNLSMERSSNRGVGTYSYAEGRQVASRDVTKGRVQREGGRSGKKRGGEKGHVSGDQGN